MVRVESQRVPGIYFYLFIYFWSRHKFIVFFLLLLEPLSPYRKLCELLAHSPSPSTPKVAINELINYLAHEAALGTAVRP